MIYKDLNEIPLQRFISVYFGDYKALIKSGTHSDDELSETAAALILDYISIIGGRQILSEISKRNEQLDHSVKIECMEACKNLIKVEQYEKVSEILSIFGYQISPVKKEQLKTKVESILGNSLFRMNLNSGSDKPSTASQIDHDTFVKERVILMQHYKMHIDPSVFTAGEYAYMIKGMCEEMDRMNSKK